MSRPGPYVLHLVATRPSDGDHHANPVDGRTLGTYETEQEAQEAGRIYLRAHPSAWLQTQDADYHETGRDVEVAT